MRGDLSAPVLAIIVTIGIIAAGLVLLAWFFWFAPQAGKTGALQILGQPAVFCQTGLERVVISVKNTGSERIQVTEIIVGGIRVDIGDVTLDPGETRDISEPLPQGTPCPATWKYTVDGVVVTTAGTYATSFTVIKEAG
jgi:hypothetical protein